MNKSTLAAVAALAAVAVPTAAFAAEAGTDKTAKAVYQSKIVVKGQKATLKVKYQCAKGETLWLSAKQVKSLKKDQALTKEGSSGISSAWWDSHRNKITCDGKSHTSTFTIDKVEPGKKGKLKKGWAYVQFCITIPGATETDEGELTYSKSTFERVK